jgi:hypothetical protein
LRYEGKTYSRRFLFRDNTIFNLPGSGLYDRKEGERERGEICTSSES